ncbi:5-formyltetrahydrofolate cyclo-ligase [Rhodococcus sp. HNM0569]|uniref:5-formyltetrahydrofolate cyclo-ligase n=1 Tax=Rhodococcus sp. HNM0569 TaxID=2716340 RepID=UPI00146D4FDB|nr:5-formyltetrahydrofolate cyclo-ligase [Rhodococcus sp. HNM0569]
MEPAGHDPDLPEHAVSPSDKARWRGRVLEARRALGATDRAREGAALADAAARAITTGETVATYHPVWDEPGADALLDAIARVAGRVLLPLTPRRPGPLEWAPYAGPASLAAGRFGIREPTAPPVSAGEFAAATTVFVPALAVDRRGVRLGRGAGFYDRTLGAADPSARLVAVVRDDELVDALPEDPHDVRMGWALTPGGGLVRLS